jgi:hypothetical protein
VDAKSAARWKALIRIVFDLGYRGAAASFWIATERRWHVGVGIARWSGLLAEQAAQEIQDDSKS